MWKTRALAKEEGAVSVVSVARRLSSVATDGLSIATNCLTQEVGLLPAGVSQNGCEAGGSPSGSRAGVGLSTRVSQAGAAMLRDCYTRLSHTTVTHDCHTRLLDTVVTRWTATRRLDDGY